MLTFLWPQLSHMTKPSCKVRRGMWHFVWMANYAAKRQSFITKEEEEDGCWVGSSCFCRVGVWMKSLHLCDPSY